MSKKVVWNSQARKLVAQVKGYFDEEKCLNSAKFSFDQSMKRTSEATGIPLRTIERICCEKRKLDEAEEEVLTPNKKRLRKKKIDLDEMDIGIIRRTIQQFYVEGEVPTLRKLKKKLQKEILWDGCAESLRKVLINIGFKFKKCKSERILLIEKSEIAAARNSYLRKMRAFRKDPSKTIIFIDESYIHTSHVRSKCWQSNDVHGTIQACSKGARFILLHAGMESGFVPNAKLTFKSGLKTGDYHDDMNHENFLKWFVEKFLPNIPENSVIVLDNAPYHNVLRQKQPTSSWLKSNIVTWLIENGITIPEKAIKPELLQLAKQHKKPKEFVIDKLAEEKGHIILRLPPYHPDLNPIELIWAQVKQFVGAYQTKAKATDIIDLCDKAFDDIQQRNAWRDVCRHVVDVENNYWDASGIMDEAVERVIISVGGEETSDEESSEEDGSN